MEMYIDANRFSEFVDEIIIITNEEEENATLWELYLHKVYEESWGEFYDTYKSTKIKKTEEDYETTIENSKHMLEGFNMKKGKEENNG